VRTQGQLDQKLLMLVTLGLVAFGLVMVYSATSASAALGNGNPMAFLERQAVYAFLGIVGMAVASRFDYRRLRYLAPALLLAALVLCSAVLVVAPAINGARRWFVVGPASFQPSEVAKLALCLFAAAYLARRPAPRSFGRLVKPLGLVTAAFCLLVLLEPDLGTTITLGGMMLAILLVAGVPVRLLALTTTLALAAGFAAVWIEPYRRARVFSFLDPWKDAQGSGFQIVQAMIGIGSGGISGVGLGKGVEKALYLPEAHTDMIFAVIGEELGLIGLTSLVCGQAAINLAAVLGIAPLTGIPLPFVSYGGSSLVVLLAGVGILLNIAVSGEAVRAQVPDRGRRDGRTRPAGARGRGSAAGSRSDGDVRRVARSRRVASGS